MSSGSAAPQPAAAAAAAAGADASLPAALELGLAAIPKRREYHGLYEVALQARKVEVNRGRVRDVLGDLAAMEEEREQEERAHEQFAPRGDWRWVEGARYWLNTATGERSWKAPEIPAGPPPEISTGSPPEIPAGPSPSLVDARPDGEVARLQSVAEAYGYAAALAANEDRNRALTIELRRANNFVKDGPIRVCLGFWAHVLAAQHGVSPPADPRARAAPRLEVLDLCCGRGQDFDKFRRACRDSLAVLSKLVGVDVAGREAARSACDRWAQTSDRVMSDTREAGTAVMMGGVLTADLAAVHASRAIDEAAERARWDDDSLPAPGSAHLATCFFALHYFFRTEAALRNLLAGASWLLRDGGFFATIHADGEAISAAFRGCGEEGTISFRAGHATLRMHEATAEMLRGGDPAAAAAAAAAPPSAFGWAYDFHLPGAVENVTEYLVHSPTRDRIADEMHLVKIFDESAEVVLRRMCSVPFWREAYDKCEVDTRRAGVLADETLDGLALYRVVIYVKSPLRCDIHAVRRFVRAKMGFPE